MRKIFVVFCLILIGCSSSTTEEVISFPSETSLGSQVFFCPRQNCGEVLTTVIDSAQTSVHCALFDLRLKNVVSSLTEKSKNIDVKIVVDNENYGYITGSRVKQDTKSQFSHNKFCIIDEKIVTTGSFNPTKRGSSENNNNLIVIHSKFLSENYEEEFDELWSGNFGNGNLVKNPIISINDKKIENYFCPEDNCKEKVIEAINKANQSIHFMAFSFTDEEVADAILFKDIEIKGIFEKFQAGSQYSQFHRMKDFGLDVKKDNNSAFLHHKVFIIDGKTVITGSANPSGSGFFRNDENILIIHDEKIAEEYLEEFGLIWKQGESFK